MQNELVHLHGLYDADNKTDVVVYEPDTARFFMLLSTRNWDPAQAVSRWFDTALRADAIAAPDAGAGAPAVRHGGVAVPAEKEGGRGVLRVWDPYTGNWHTNWDPINSSSVSSVQWGAPGDFPLAGPIDRNAGGRTDYVVYRWWSSPPSVFIKDTSGGTAPPINVSGGTSRLVVSAVRDMKGSDDGKGDIVVLDPDAMVWRRFYSPTFSEQASITFGDLGAVAQ